MGITLKSPRKESRHFLLFGPPGYSHKNGGAGSCGRLKNLPARHSNRFWNITGLTSFRAQTPTISSSRCVPGSKTMWAPRLVSEETSKRLFGQSKQKYFICPLRRTYTFRLPMPATKRSLSLTVSCRRYLPFGDIPPAPAPVPQTKHSSISELPLS